MLCSRILQVHLGDQEDSICWKLTTGSTYITKTAYEIQFVGCYPDFEWNKVCQVRVEPKCKKIYMATYDSINMCSGQDPVATTAHEAEYGLSKSLDPVRIY
jgi:hypothetical protein